MPSNGQTNIFNVGTVAPQIAAFFGDNNLYSSNTQTNPTYASAITLDTTAANTFFLTTTSAVGNTTVTPGTINPAGQQIQIVITGDASLYSTNTQMNPTYASTIAIDTTAANNFFLTTTSAVGNTTLTPGTINPAGQQIQIVITGDASAIRTITFGTGFLATGTLATVVSKTSVIDFTSNGTAYVETGRQTTGV